MISFNSSSVLHSVVVGRMRVTEKKPPSLQQVKDVLFQNEDLRGENLEENCKDRLDCKASNKEN